MPNLHQYRGLEITLLIYRHTAFVPGRARNDDQGFDAAVQIRERLASAIEPRSRVFKLNAEVPFRSVGDTNRASKLYAEGLIDACPPNRTVFDIDT